jgi:hypothetical protein
VSGTATDLAANTATASLTVSLDMTPPTITGSINPPPDAGGYNSGPVTVTFNCADALSGIASCTFPVAVTGEVTGYPVTGTAVDIAGNTASTTVTVNISFNYFKVRSWQTNPAGDPSQTGKCLDYGTSPSGNGASVFLNDCANAHPIRVFEIGPTPADSPPGTPCASPRIGSGGTPLCHEVLLFAGNLVIGIHNSQTITTGATSSPPQPATEYQLELQPPFGSIIGSAIFSPANQIFRLDGDSIIREGSSIDATGAVVPGPCLNTDTLTCPPPPLQLVIQVQNARGANGSPFVAAVRNLGDNEFWDFIPQPVSRQYPTSGFQSVSSPDGLWNAICLNPAAPLPPIPPPSTCAPNGFNAGWGSVILASSPV